MELSCGSVAAQLLMMAGVFEGRRWPEMISVWRRIWEDSLFCLFVCLLTTLAVEVFRLGCGAASLGCWCPTFRDHVVHEPFDSCDAVSKRRV